MVKVDYRTSEWHDNLIVKNKKSTGARKKRSWVFLCPVCGRIPAKIYYGPKTLRRFAMLMSSRKQAKDSLHEYRKALARKFPPGSCGCK